MVFYVYFGVDVAGLEVEYQCGELLRGGEKFVWNVEREMGEK